MKALSWGAMKTSEGTRSEGEGPLGKCPTLWAHVELKSKVRESKDKVDELVHLCRWWCLTADVMAVFKKITSCHDLPLFFIHVAPISVMEKTTNTRDLWSSSDPSLTVWRQFLNLPPLHLSWWWTDSCFALTWWHMGSSQRRKTLQETCSFGLSVKSDIWERNKHTNAVKLERRQEVFSMNPQSRNRSLGSSSLQLSG